MWVIRVESFGSYGCLVPLGNDGAQKLRNKTLRGWLSETETLRKMGGTVYIVNNYTAEMRAMSSKQLANYLITYGRILT